MSNWNPDSPDPPDYFEERLQHFDYMDPKQREMAEAFRREEVPFKMYNVPEVDEVTKKWSVRYLR